MFRNFYSEGRLSEGQSAPSSSPLGVPSVAFDGQENSWIGLLSRPALSLLRKFRLWSAAPAEVRNSLIGEEREILRQLNEIMPLTPPPAAAAQHLGYTPWPHDGTAGLLETGIGSSVSWLNVGDLGYFSPVRTLINQVLFNSQEPSEGNARVSRSGSVGKAGPWWGSFLRGGERSEEGTVTGWLCPPLAETTPVLGSKLREEPRPPRLVNNNGVQNTEEQLGGGEAGRPPEQDNGYSSLEEELSQRGLLSQQEPHVPRMEEIPERQPEPEGVLLPPPQCRNKNIAFIMGCPCTDDDDDDESSQSEPESDDDDDVGCDDEDDGFDSVGSSDLSASSDEGEEEEDTDSDSEPDSESERLWDSLCRSLDPYNPRNFTAHLHTGSASTSARQSPPPPASTSPPSAQDAWEDSTSASEADEAESLRLLSSFSCSSDPYSPLNFKAPLRTRGPTGGHPKTGGHPNAASPPEYRKEEAEERLDSGFAEASASSLPRSCKASKKVRFCDDVEEFFASCGEEEDRRGPWEELARDRCRFLRRCQEVEQSIGFCLQQQHRRRVFQRLYAFPHS